MISPVIYNLFNFIGGWERKRVILFSLTFQLNHHLYSAQVLLLHNSEVDSDPQLGLQY